jgi:hypothetical protein
MPLLLLIRVHCTARIFYEFWIWFFPDLFTPSDDSVGFLLYVFCRWKKCRSELTAPEQTLYLNLHRIVFDKQLTYTAA